LDARARLEGRRVLIDGRMAAGVGGGFTYLVNVIPRLARAAPGTRFRLLYRTEGLERSIRQMRNLELFRVEPQSAWTRLRFTLWDAPRLARSWRAELFFSVSEYSPPRASCPVIASFRNAYMFSALADGPWRDLPRRLTVRTLAGLSARNCARIMFVSADTARWMGDAAGVPPERRFVVHHGIDLDTFRDSVGDPPHDRPYVLSVGSIYRYKNFVRLIEGYGEMARRHEDAPDLVIIGDNQEPEYEAKMQEARRQSGVEDQIRIVGEVSYYDIRAYYAHAEAYVMPSYLETFGHPLLEAMASGAPVVASDIGVFRELTGDAALYADAKDSSSYGNAIERLLYEPGLAQRLAARGRERVAHFTWDHTVERLLELFAEAVEG